jgi:nitrite reductase/ring-hydroxylating ferredoxin subunit
MICRKLYTILMIDLMIAFFLLTGCKKNENNPSTGQIPDVYVNFNRYPNTIDYIPTGGWLYVENQGYRGVIIYRLDQFTFFAYERTCPYDPQNECARVEVDQTGIILVDSCCMSKYNILDGMPMSGPSSYPLKQYITAFDGNELRVYNNP